MDVRTFSTRKGVTENATRMAMRSGRIKHTMTPEGRIDIDESQIEAWDRYTQEMKGRETNPEIQESKARAAYYKAEMMKVEYERMIGDLVPLDEAKKMISEKISNVKSRLQSLPMEIALKLAHFCEDGKLNTVEEIIRKEIENAVNELSKKRG